MNKIKLPVILYLLCTGFTLFAQHEPDNSKPGPSWDLGFEGMLASSVGKQFYAFNVGGPSFLFRVNRNFRIGVGAIPSFYISDGKTGAKLGVAPRIDYKSIVLIAPFYHFDTTDEWIFSAGLGYKFHR
jgi:hypothetical protein